MVPIESYSQFTFFRFLKSLQRPTYITPTSYLELIKTFKKLLEKKRFDLLSLKNRYLVGLEKLENTEASIADMQKYLFEKQPVLQSHKEVLKRDEPMTKYG